MATVSSIMGFGLPKSRPTTVSERVQQLIEKREEFSERLIGWVQLIVVLTFATLYFVSPRPADAGLTMYEPVPIALAAYGSFTVVRLLMSYAMRLPGWFLLLSIVVDVTLLMRLIWAIHLQYAQPAAFSLKVPTLYYVFIFIALRALRFDYRYVLLAGVSFALGWLAMLVAAINTDGSDVITRSFTSYINGNRILIGAEFDKIYAILMVSGLLAFAVGRARAVLVHATTEEIAGSDIRRFIPGEVADAITMARERVEAGAAIEREAAVVMLDIRGFTKLAADVSPQRLVEILTSFHKRIVPLVETHNGVIDKFLGDGVMITFGAARPSQTASADALRTLCEIMEVSADWVRQLPEAATQGGLDVNGAAAAGRVVFATLGSAGRLEYTVIGEAANLAAKLEKHNKVAGSRALTSAATYEHALAQRFAPQAEPRALRAAQVMGLREPVDLIALV